MLVLMEDTTEPVSSADVKLIELAWSCERLGGAADRTRIVLPLHSRRHLPEHGTDEPVGVECVALLGKRRELRADQSSERRSQIDDIHDVHDIDHLVVRVRRFDQQCLAQDVAIGTTGFLYGGFDGFPYQIAQRPLLLVTADEAAEASPARRAELTD